MMYKKINIKPTAPITSVNPPIRNRVRNVKMSTDDIRKCIIARAIVEEVLPDGSTITLNFTNYNKDNTPVKKDTTEAKAAIKEAKTTIKVSDKVSVRESLKTKVEEAKEEAAKEETATTMTEIKLEENAEATEDEAAGEELKAITDAGNKVEKIDTPIGGTTDDGLEVMDIEDLGLKVNL